MNPNPTSSLLKENLHKIINIARLAPSVHNTQPWHVSLNNKTIKISLDNEHILNYGDPTKRETYISLGIFTQAIAIASEAFGFKPQKVSLLDSGSEVTFANTMGLSNKSDGKIGLLQTRCSDRSIYQKVQLSTIVTKKITTSCKINGVKIWIIKDEVSIDRISDFTSKGIGLALTNPDFRKELSEYLVPPWSNKKRGISVKSLYIPWLAAAVEPINMKLGIGINSEVELERKRWQSSSAIILITTTGDVPKYWFLAGRAYLFVSLEIENQKLSQATSAATVEASNYHEDIEKMLGTEQRLQSVLRIGKGSDERVYSPRVSADSLITLN